METPWLPRARGPVGEGFATSARALASSVSPSGLPPRAKGAGTPQDPRHRGSHLLLLLSSRHAQAEDCPDGSSDFAASDLGGARDAVLEAGGHCAGRGAGPPRPVTHLGP